MDAIANALKYRYNRSTFKSFFGIYSRTYEVYIFLLLIYLFVCLCKKHENKNINILKICLNSFYAYPNHINI